MKFLKKLTISIFLLSSLVVSNANAGDCKARLGDFDWSSANIHTAITQFILEKGYGCEVSVTKGSTTPIMAIIGVVLPLVTETSHPYPFSRIN